MRTVGRKQAAGTLLTGSGALSARSRTERAWRLQASHSGTNGATHRLMHSRTMPWTRPARTSMRAHALRRLTKSSHFWVVRRWCLIRQGHLSTRRDSRACGARTRASPSSASWARATTGNATTLITRVTLAAAHPAHVYNERALPTGCRCRRARAARSRDFPAQLDF